MYIYIAYHRDNDFRDKKQYYTTITVLLHV